MTSPSTPRARRRAKRRQSILDTALELIGTHGLDGLTVHALATALDLTPGALYRYFKSKDEILVALAVHVVTSLRDSFAAAASSMDAALTDTDASPAIKALAPLWLVCDVYGTLGEDRPHQFQLLSLLLGTPKPIVETSTARAGVMPTFQLLGELAMRFDAAAAAGAFTPALAIERVILLWSSLHGMLERRKLNRLVAQPFDLEHLTTELVKTLFVGWGAHRDDVEAARQLSKQHTGSTPP